MYFLIKGQYLFLCVNIQKYPQNEIKPCLLFLEYKFISSPPTCNAPGTKNPNYSQKLNVEADISPNFRSGITIKYFF